MLVLNLDQEVSKNSPLGKDLSTQASGMTEYMFQGDSAELQENGKS